MALEICPGSKVLFVGDSITDCGRMFENRPLGDGYVSLVRDLISAKYPGHQLQLVNRGVSGDTVIDLMNRWSDDVIAHQPDWISVKVGINDAIRWERRDPERAVSPEEYQQRYNRLLARATEETEAKLVLVTPFFMSRDESSDSWRSSVLGLLPSYIEIVRTLAQQYGATLIDMHQAFQQQLEHVDPYELGPEPVHPNRRGHMVIAQAWLAALGW